MLLSLTVDPLHVCETIYDESASFFNRPEENTGYVIAQKHKPSPAPPKPSGPATPAPTPWLQFGSKVPISAGLYRDLTQSSLARAASSIPAGGQLEDGTMKMRVTQPMDREGLISSSVGVAWQASKSQVLGTQSSAAVQLNTPRILELDVNRIMIGQTDVRYIVIIFFQTARATFIWLLTRHC